MLKNWNSILGFHSFWKLLIWLSVSLCSLWKIRSKENGHSKCWSACWRKYVRSWAGRELGRDGRLGLSNNWERPWENWAKYTKIMIKEKKCHQLSEDWLIKNNKNKPNWQKPQQSRQPKHKIRRFNNNNSHSNNHRMNNNRCKLK